ncbi:hypothetical protein [Rahnella sp. RcJ3]|uniref:hypothetical protein n=1 Tax=Rahnella sp. RcJ3 TaxID=2292446 RepID=UPI001885FA34|nr:hypothetical protein [Rahnella sp. RcJ3]
MKTNLLLILIAGFSSFVAAQSAEPLALQKSFPLSDFIRSGVSLKYGDYLGKKAIKMQMPAENFQDPTKEVLTDRKFMAWLPVDFHDGIIEVDIASTLAHDAPAYARGFLGLSFRIDKAERFENIYLRPTNSQADDQVRRNHSVQYFAYPDYTFERLRKETPEKYETYADIALERWIHMKITVSGQQARLYLDHSSTPALLVNDLKLGSEARGGVGVWIESGTTAYFNNLKISSKLPDAHPEQVK